MSHQPRCERRGFAPSSAQEQTVGGGRHHEGTRYAGTRPPRRAWRGATTHGSRGPPEEPGARLEAERVSARTGRVARAADRKAALPAAELPGMGRHRMRGAPTRHTHPLAGSPRAGGYPGGEYRRGGPLGGNEGGEAERRSSTARSLPPLLPRGGTGSRRNPEGRSTMQWTLLSEFARAQGGPARSGFILLEALTLPAVRREIQTMLRLWCGRCPTCGGRHAAAGFG